MRHDAQAGGRRQEAEAGKKHTNIREGSRQKQSVYLSRTCFFRNQEEAPVISEKKKKKKQAAAEAEEEVIHSVT